LDPRDFIGCAMSNPANAALLSRLPSLALDQCHLTAGCLFQAVWNRSSGQAANWGIKDYDVFYFDERDLSWDAEDAVIQRVAALADDLGIRVETRNQARVHLWYEQRFGTGYPKLASAPDGIDRYLISCTCVGIEVARGELYAPNGLQDLESGILRMNPLNARSDLFRLKAENYRARWPWLTIVDGESRENTFETP
jgi:uncharacterized protein